MVRNLEYKVPMAVLVIFNRGECDRIREGDMAHKEDMSRLNLTIERMIAKFRMSIKSTRKAKCLSKLSFGRSVMEPSLSFTDKEKLSE